MAFIFFLIIGLVPSYANAKVSIIERCSQQAKEHHDVSSDIFSIVIDLTYIKSQELNQAMEIIYYGRLQIIEWDRRTEHELRVFVTPWDNWSRPVIKKLFLRLKKLHGVRVMCVPTQLGLEEPLL